MHVLGFVFAVVEGRLLTKYQSKSDLGKPDGVMRTMLIISMLNMSGDVDCESRTL